MRQECRERFPKLQRKPLVNDPSMHHGTCVTHVQWCMLGSLTRGGGEMFPAFLAHVTHVFCPHCLYSVGNKITTTTMRNPQFYVSGKRPNGVYDTHVQLAEPRSPSASCSATSKQNNIPKMAPISSGHDCCLFTAAVCTNTWEKTQQWYKHHLNVYIFHKLCTWHHCALLCCGYVVSSWRQHGAYLGPVGPRWAPCWPHKPCY